MKDPKNFIIFVTKQRTTCNQNKYNSNSRDLMISGKGWGEKGSTPKYIFHLVEWQFFQRIKMSELTNILLYQNIAP